MWGPPFWGTVSTHFSSLMEWIIQGSGTGHNLLRGKSSGISDFWDSRTPDPLMTL